jgi:TolA-binding protein
MAFYEDPIKSKRVFIVFLSLSTLFFIGCGVLGYLYWHEYRINKNKTADITQKDTQITDLKKEISGLTNATNQNSTSLAEQNKNLTAQNTSLTNQVKSYKAKIAKANAYNEFFKYLTAVIQAHSGFSGWTEGEFQTAKQKAEATGDASFVSTVNWAWYETTVDVTTRVIRVWNEIASGIENALK